MEVVDVMHDWIRGKAEVHWPDVRQKLFRRQYLRVAECRLKNATRSSSDVSIYPNEAYLNFGQVKSPTTSLNSIAKEQDLQQTKENSRLCRQSACVTRSRTCPFLKNRRHLPASVAE